MTVPWQCWKFEGIPSSRSTVIYELLSGLYQWADHIALVDGNVDPLQPCPFPDWWQLWGVYDTVKSNKTFLKHVQFFYERSHLKPEAESCAFAGWLQTLDTQDQRTHTYVSIFPMLFIATAVNLACWLPTLRPQIIFINIKLLLNRGYGKP